MPRREFTKAVKVKIVRRATKAGVVYCEACGSIAKIWHIDHTVPDALQVDKSKPLTADDGKLLCAGSRDTCHGRKTAEEDQPAIAKAKRREAQHLGVKGRGTALAGPDHAEKREIREARSKNRRGDRLPTPTRRIWPGFESAGSARR